MMWSDLRSAQNFIGLLFRAGVLDDDIFFGDAASVTAGLTIKLLAIDVDPLLFWRF